MRGHTHSRTPIGGPSLGECVSESECQSDKKSVRVTLLSDEQVTGHHATARTWSDSNPYKARLLALKGGLHRPPQTSDDRIIMADEDAVALMRDYPAAVNEFAPEF